MKWTIETDGAGATLVVTRTCGHVDRLWYGTRKFAENAVDEAVRQKCLACRNVDRVKAGFKSSEQEVMMST